jgi:hypothetical protein
MPIPDLDEEGFLPAGVHDCSLAEIGDRFGRFQGSDRRCRLFEKLDAYVSETGRIGLIAELVVDGSFVTGKPEPNDVDLVIALDPGIALGADFPPCQYLYSRRDFAAILVALTDRELNTRGPAGSSSHHLMYRNNSPE